MKDLFATNSAIEKSETALRALRAKKTVKTVHVQQKHIQSERSEIYF